MKSIIQWHPSARHRWAAWPFWLKMGVFRPSKWADMIFSNSFEKKTMCFLLNTKSAVFCFNLDLALGSFWIHSQGHIILFGDNYVGSKQKGLHLKSTLLRTSLAPVWSGGFSVDCAGSHFWSNFSWCLVHVLICCLIGVCHCLVLWYCFTS